MPAANPTYDELITRVVALEQQLTDGNLPLDALPMQGLSDRLATIMVPEADQFLLPQTIGHDSVGVLPGIRLRKTVNAGPAGVYVVEWDTVDWKNEIQFPIPAAGVTAVTVDIPGKYLVIHNGYMTQNGAGYYSHGIYWTPVGLARRPVAENNMYNPGDEGPEFTGSASAILQCNSGDKLEAYANLGGGFAGVYHGDNAELSNFEVHWIGQ